jgi:hypothetical protein
LTSGGEFQWVFFFDRASSSAKSPRNATKKTTASSPSPNHELSSIGRKYKAASEQRPAITPHRKYLRKDTVGSWVLSVVAQLNRHPRKCKKNVDDVSLEFHVISYSPGVGPMGL